MLDWLEASRLSVWMRGEPWGWPLALTAHVLGTALAVGFVFILCLRLLGLFKLLPYAALSRMFPVVWAALTLQIVSGLALWVTKPAQYAADAAFMLKLLLAIAGTAAIISLYGTLDREAASWSIEGGASARARKLAAAALAIWCAVLVAGRLTAHLGALPIG